MHSPRSHGRSAERHSEFSDGSPRHATACGPRLRKSSSRFCRSASEADALLATPAFARWRRCFDQRVKRRQLECQPCSHAVNAILTEPTPRLADDLFRSIGARTAATDMSHTGLAPLSRLAPSFFRIPSENGSDAA
ncbi:hypothetical protein L1887_47195 [Cichorium endivia]|nr:hypothetical protein L1887_47195 [Cichorium endivia]